MAGDIPELRDDNYRIWKERVLLQLGLLDIDYAIRQDEPIITETSTADEIAVHERWERSNRLSVMFIKTKMSSVIRLSVDHHDNVRQLMKGIDEQFESTKKTRASILIAKLYSQSLTTVGAVREHIMQIMGIAADLNALDNGISESFLYYLILNTLPEQYDPFIKIHDRLGDKWSIHQLLVHCVLEEERLMKDLEERHSEPAKKRKVYAKPLPSNGLTEMLECTA